MVCWTVPAVLPVHPCAIPIVYPGAQSGEVGCGTCRTALQVVYIIYSRWGTNSGRWGSFIVLPCGMWHLARGDLFNVYMHHLTQLVHSFGQDCYHSVMNPAVYADGRLVRLCMWVTSGLGGLEFNSQHQPWITWEWLWKPMEAKVTNATRYGNGCFGEIVPSLSSFPKNI